MPFTFSHPAIILPFATLRHLSLSALVVGSLTPDFEYFVKMKLSGRYSHSLEGMFVLDFPLAIGLALIFHQVVKKPLIDNLPAYFNTRLKPLRDVDFPGYIARHPIAFGICLLVGIGSHLLWDSFTHANSYFVDHIAFLSTPVVMDGLPQVPFFRYLQHLSTAVGAICIFLFFHHLPASDEKTIPGLKFWIITFTVAGISFAVRSFFSFEYFGDLVTSVISAGFIGVIVASLFTRLSHG
jgi:hypothetical protein